MPYLWNIFLPIVKTKKLSTSLGKINLTVSKFKVYISDLVMLSSPTTVFARVWISGSSDGTDFGRLYDNNLLL